MKNYISRNKIHESTCIFCIEYSYKKKTEKIQPYFFFFTRWPKFSWHRTEFSKLALKPVHLYGNCLLKLCKAHHYSSLPITTTFPEHRLPMTVRQRKYQLHCILSTDHRQTQFNTICSRYFKSLFFSIKCHISKLQLWAQFELYSSLFYLNELLLSCSICKQLTDGTFLQSNTGNMQ